VHFELPYYTIAARITRTGTQISAPNSRFLISCAETGKLNRKVVPLFLEI
jgi:hypothetical protein